MNALKLVEVIAPAYSSFFNNEVVPVFRSGFLPPIHDGFDRYLADPEMAKLFKDYAKKRALGAEAGEYDSHPPTAERVAAIARLAGEGVVDLVRDLGEGALVDLGAPGRLPARI